MSTLAVLVIVLGIPLSIGAFFVMRPLPAALVVVLGAEMFLPVGSAFTLPFVHGLGKHNLFYACALLGCLLRCPSRITRRPKDNWVILIALIALVGGSITGFTNGDAIILGRGGGVLSGLNLKDGLSLVLSEFFPSLVSFYLGYALVRDAADVERVLMALGVAGLLYCPFAIIEMRMSPQFHQWIYGYNTGQFDQGIRWGGYRPKVFMSHGLALARFFTATTVALFFLGKVRCNLLGLPIRFLAWFQLVVLVLCKSTGAIILALVGVLLALLVRPKRQLLVASILAFMTVIYPLLRATDLFPVAGVLDAAAPLGQDRRGSLEFRFTNEDRLLVRARERLWFGWGNGRYRIYDEDGHDISVTDGYWITVFGVNGLAGFVVGFGALLWPVFSARHRLSNCGDERENIQITGLAVIVVLIGLDLIPNGLFSVFPFMLSGVLTRGLRELEPTETTVA